MTRVSTARPVTPASERAADWFRLARRLRQETVDREFSPSPSDRVLVVAAHPDDETFAAGATIAAVARLAEVHVLALTDGEAAVAHVGLDIPGLRARRRAELAAACRDLGVRGQTHVGLPDGGLADLPDRIDVALADTAAHLNPTLVLSIWWDDPHPDHRAAGLGALRLARHRHVPVFGFPLWAPHWSDPGAVIDPAKAVMMRPDDQSVSARASAVGRFGSQLEPLAAGFDAVLPRFVLDWTTEIAIRP